MRLPFFSHVVAFFDFVFATEQCCLSLDSRHLAVSCLQAVSHGMGCPREHLESVSSLVLVGGSVRAWWVSFAVFQALCRT